MSEIDRLLADAAIRYLALLEAGAPISISAFVADADPAIRAELAAYLAFVLDYGQPVGPAQLTPDEQAIAARSRQRSRERLQARLQPAASRSFTELRTARRLSTGRLAQMVDLPADLLLRIERGGVIAASIPDRLVVRLAEALGAAAHDVRAMLAAPVALGEVKLSAQDGTTVVPETPIPFAEALARSGASAVQRAAWSPEAL